MKSCGCIHRSAARAGSVGSASRNYGSLVDQKEARSGKWPAEWPMEAGSCKSIMHGTLETLPDRGRKREVEQKTCEREFGTQAGLPQFRLQRSESYRTCMRIGTASASEYLIGLVLVVCKGKPSTIPYLSAGWMIPFMVPTAYQSTTSNI